MKNSLKFKEERASHIAELEGLVQKAKVESRDFTQDEEVRQTELNDAIYALDNKIAQAEKTEEIMLRSLAGEASKSEEREMEKHAKEYSLQDAIQQFRSGNKLQGREKEMAEEAQREFREAGVSPTGHIQIPMAITHRATSLFAGTTGASEQSVLSGLVPASILEAAGANRITGVAGTVILPSLPSDATASVTEVATKAASSAMSKVEIAPTRIASRIDVSSQMLVASTNTFDSVVAAQFRKHSGGLLDAKAWSNFIEQGAKVLRSTSAAATIPAIDFASANDLIGAMGDADALSNSAAFFSSHAQLAVARSQQAVTNGGIPTLQTDGTIAGYRAYGHSQINSDLLTATDVDTFAEVYNNGTGTSTINNETDALPFLLVNMDDVYCCYWGGADLVVDNMTLAEQGIVRLIMNYYANCKVGHGASVKYVAVA